MKQKIRSNIMLKRVTYVRYLLTGNFFRDEKIEKVENRELENLKIPENAYAIQFFEQNETHTTDGKVWVGSKIRFSKIKYFGTLYKWEDIIKKFPELKELIPKMKEDGWAGIVKTRCGNWRLLEKGDTVQFAC